MSGRAVILATLLSVTLVASVHAARVTDGLVVGYDFREGGGAIVGDHSGFDDPLDLTIHDPSAVAWNGDGSITFTDSTIISSASLDNVPPEGSAIKIYDAITSTDAITIEAWVSPDNLIDNSGPARVVSMSVDPSNRNFTLGQDENSWQARFRAVGTSLNGFDPGRQTDPGTATTDLQHIVYVRRFPEEESLIYIDGEEMFSEATARTSGPITGDVSNWDDTYDFGLGNELTWANFDERDFLGTMYLVAVFDRGLTPEEIMANFLAGEFALVDGGGAVQLQAGDADQDLDFDQIDLVQVQIAAKYLTGQAATWGEGDWDGAPGGEPGNPPTGNGLFDQLDIIAALAPGHYLTGPYAAVGAGGQAGDEQTSIVYDPGTGELAVDAPASTELTSINIDSAGGIFTGDMAQNLGGSFDNDADNNIFKATFGSSFGSISFGNAAQPGLSEDFVLNDLSVIGSLAGGGDLGAVDLIYVPEPSTGVLLGIAVFVLSRFRRRVA